MDFFGIGILEVLLILVVALIIWGPGRVVEVGMKLGKIARTMKKATSDLTTQLTKEIEGGDEEPPASTSKEKQGSDSKGSQRGA